MNKIFVLGSAPGAEIPRSREDYFLIAANGSIAPFYGLVPDVLVLNGFTLAAKSGIGVESMERLRGRRVKQLIVIDNAKDSRLLVQRSGIECESILFWSKERRREICSKQSGISYPGLTGNQIPSTGVTALCFALGLGGEVFVSGLDVESQGHSYGHSDFARGHLEWDAKTLCALEGKFKKFLNLRSAFEDWWRANMNVLEMDLHRKEFPMTRYCEQPYACHETQRAWMAFAAGRAAQGVEE